MGFMRTRSEHWRSYRERIKKTPDALFPAPRIKATDQELAMLRNTGKATINVRYAGLGLPKTERVDTMEQRAFRRKAIYIIQGIAFVLLLVAFIVLFVVISKE